MARKKKDHAPPPATAPVPPSPAAYRQLFDWLRAANDLVDTLYAAEARLLCEEARRRLVELRPNQTPMWTEPPGPEKDALLPDYLYSLFVQLPEPQREPPETLAEVRAECKRLEESFESRLKWPPGRGRQALTGERAVAIARDKLTQLWQRARNQAIDNRIDPPATLLLITSLELAIGEAAGLAAWCEVASRPPAETPAPEVAALPSPPEPETPPPSPAPVTEEAATPAAFHSQDFRSVHWFGQDHHFTATQAHCIEVLWREWEKAPGMELGETTILESANVDSSRLVDVFRVRKRGQAVMHTAWGTMIKPGQTRGSFKLAR